ncbi:unnamed protein product [Arctogadus glacialis]
MGRSRVRNRKRRPKPEDLIQQESLHQEGLHQEGLQQESLHQEGLQQEGLHQESLQQEGLHRRVSTRRVSTRRVSYRRVSNRRVSTRRASTRREGLHQESLHQEGLHQEGLHQESLQQEGLQQEGLHQESLQQEGLHQESLQLESLHQEGLQQESLHQESLQQRGLHQESLQQEGLQQEGLHQETLHQETLHPEGLQAERPDGTSKKRLQHMEGLLQEGEMVRTPGVLEAEEEALEEFASTSGLSALNQGHTSPTHMETNTEPGVKALGTVTARLPPRPDRTSKKSLKQMVIVLYLSCPLLGRHLYKDSGDLEMPADHGNQHVVVRQHPIDAMMWILNQDQPAATALPGVVEIEEKPFVFMGCTEPVAPPNNSEISDMPDEEGEEPVQEPKRKGLGWRFLNWLCVVKEKEPNHKRNARTYLKEDTEEHLISSKAYKRQAALLSTKLSMAEGEQMRMKIYRAERRQQKEAQRLKEEQRYEQWAAERGLSDAGEGPAEGPKKRMTRLQKVSLGLVALCQ